MLFKHKRGVLTVYLAGVIIVWGAGYKNIKEVN